MWDLQAQTGVWPESPQDEGSQAVRGKALRCSGYPCRPKPAEGHDIPPNPTVTLRLPTQMALTVRNGAQSSPKHPREPSHPAHVFCFLQSWLRTILGTSL